MAVGTNAGAAVSPPTPRTIQELLVLCDEPFVEAVYRAVLGREADPSGRATYTAMLREGAEKAAIVVTLALSAEGRQRTQALQGLDNLLAARSPRRRSLLTRLVARWRRADTLQAEETQRLLRVVENQIGRLEARLEGQAVAVAEMRGTLAQVSISVDMLRSGTASGQGSSGSAADQVPQRQVPSEVDRVFRRLRQAVARRHTRVER